ncbi:MAG TPA: S8 family serine peptidase [Tahibacter sp.]|uniref:S8 family serine peptidase n=1 Tax=Tahibacter sp. TaxID=2056211 RepID=UPI002D0A7A59|nr:S8 family serine peptidase [Tahibacter sp.]HSX60158.1 S8 family serine peptidase [Tahibacter sp.]
MSARSAVRRRLAIAVAIAAALFSSASVAAALLDREIRDALAGALPGDKLSVVVSFANASGPLTASQNNLLRAIGIRQALTFRSLPIAGALATPAQIRALAARDDVLSIYANRDLRYFNAEARQLTRVAEAQASPGDFGQALPYIGRGVTAVINDSGIDATHADLAYGSHVVQNVQALTNLNSLVAALPVTYIENQVDTDISSGHGTHCAGSFGGSGARSGGRYAGVAPGASIVGYGSGAVISILDAIGGFDYAIHNKYRFGAPIRVISNSWGTSGDFEPLDPVNLASYAAYKHDIVVLFAAGNDGPGADTHNPYAQAPWVISVAAGTKDPALALADFSSRGNPGESGSFTMPDGQNWTYVNAPTVVAPGVDIVSTRALTGLLPVLALPQDLSLTPQHVPFYTHMSGTSMATPHAAGVVALLLEANPTLLPADVRKALQLGAVPMSGHAGWEVGAGYLDAYAALQIVTQ